VPHPVFPFFPKDDGQRSSESNTRNQWETPSSDTTTSLLCNVQDYDAQMQGFIDVWPRYACPTTVTSFNPAVPILQQRKFPDADNSLVVSPRIGCISDTQLQATPENVNSQTVLGLRKANDYWQETGMSLPEGQDERVQSCYSCRWSTCKELFVTTNSLKYVELCIQVCHLRADLN